VWSTCARITDTSNGISIGKPIANTTVYILDAQSNFCPIGVPGELCIGGVGVTLGYWNRPELTAERFVPDPFSQVPEAHLYKTGDLARYLSDGAIEYLGRLDYQVKIRGQRIELGEIEATLDKHAGVGQSVVVAQGEAGDQRLMAYVVPHEQAPSSAELKEHLSSTLPPYMVPSAFVFLKALLAPRVSDVTTRAGAVAPRSATEEMVMGLFRSALERADFGVLDSFFDLGGHSLMAARLMSRLRAASGIDLPLRNLFERPTVAGMADAVDALSWSAKSKAPTGAAGDRVEIEL
jgi:hypothetical protein